MNLTSDAIIVLTVGTAAQKKLCLKLIAELALPFANIQVISDDEIGGRIGSGGAVLNAVNRYYKKSQKLIVINSGGFSKRTLCCAVKGKAFAQSLRDGKPVTLLEHIISNTAQLSESFSKGVLICCSDILVNTEGINADFECNVGFGMKSDISTAVNHGVMFADSNGEMLHFLHKYNADALRKYSGGSEDFTVDTGMVFLCDAFVEKFFTLTEELNILDFIKETKTELNFYSDILPLLSKELNAAEYFKHETANAGHLKLKEMLYGVLRGFKLKICVPDGQNFMHFGTSRQLIDNVFSLSDKSPYLLINSYIGSNVSIGSKTVLDSALIEHNSKIGSNCIISDIMFNRAVTIPDYKSVSGIKINDGSFVTVITDLDENPKNRVGEVQLWDIPRFYKGKSFFDSLDKFLSDADEEKYSLSYCTENADFDFFYNHRQYITDFIKSTPNEEYLKIRKDLVSGFFAQRSPLSRLHPVTDCVEISMPVRINLCGTWTDAMPYCTDNGGEVINAAVTVDNTLPIKVTLECVKDKTVTFISDSHETVFDFNRSNIYDDFSDFNLHKAVLETIGITDSSQLPCGLRLSTQVSIIDKGSGLGTSSILLAACFKAFSDMFCLDYSNGSIAQMVFVAEQLMKTGGGWQDQAGGLYPGIKLVSSVPGLHQELNVSSIELADNLHTVFAEKAVLLPTGQRHFGRFVVNDVVNRYLYGNPEALLAYEEMKALNRALVSSVKSDNAEVFFRCINRHMQLLKKVSPAVTNERIDSMINACTPVAQAVSICGAGAGGYLLVFLKPEVSYSDFLNFTEKTFPELNSRVLKLEIYK